MDDFEIVHGMASLAVEQASLVISDLWVAVEGMRVAVEVVVRYEARGVEWVGAAKDGQGEETPAGILTDYQAEEQEFCPEIDADPEVVPEEDWRMVVEVNRSQLPKQAVVAAAARVVADLPTMSVLEAEVSANGHAGTATVANRSVAGKNFFALHDPCIPVDSGRLVSGPCHYMMADKNLQRCLAGSNAAGLGLCARLSPSLGRRTVGGHDIHAPGRSHTPAPETLTGLCDDDDGDDVGGETTD